jgi:hypothetical protein
MNFFEQRREKYKESNETRQIDLDCMTKEQAAALANLAQGPFVLFISDKIGYGLFADRDYKEGEFITTYGGERVNDPDVGGEYVLWNQFKGYSINAEKRFLAKEKGRWMNDAIPKTMRNAEFDENFECHATRNIRRGEELFWHYGKEYENLRKLYFREKGSMMMIDLTHISKAQAAELANSIPNSPIVLDTRGVRGYGLFADRDYKTGETVTFYGGELVSANADGDYVVRLHDDDVSDQLDAEWRFEAQDKGRWINDTDKQHENVRLERTKRIPNKLRVIAIKPVKRGEEFLWWYGKDYHRPWLNLKN